MGLSGDRTRRANVESSYVINSLAPPLLPAAPPAEDTAPLVNQLTEFSLPAAVTIEKIQV